MVTTTFDARSGAIGLRSATLTHLTDGVPPTVTVLAVNPLVIKPGTVTLNGVASDGPSSFDSRSGQAGIGVASVEVRLTGSPTWQLASGTTVWAAALNVPNAPTFGLELRATDRYGQASALQTLSYIVDTTAPTLTLGLQASIGDRNVRVES